MQATLPKIVTFRDWLLAEASREFAAAKEAWLAIDDTISLTEA
jgi:hypothetical protein